MLSLSMEEGSSTFGIMAGIWAKFQRITKGKWSRHQSLGFSKCDWSPVIFPNLIWMAKKNLDS